MTYHIKATLFEESSELLFIARDDLEAVCIATEHVIKAAGRGSLLWAVGQITLREGERPVNICDRFNTIDPGRVCDDLECKGRV